MANHPKYDLRRSRDNQYYFNLTAENGQVILTSETYTQKHNAENGIESVRQNSPNDNRYQKKLAVNSQYFFTLHAANGEVIGTSEMYNSTQARDNGIAAVKRCGPIAEVEDNT